MASIIRRQGLGVKCSRPNPLRRPFHPPTSPPPGGRRGGRGPESAGRGRRGGKEMTWFVCIFVFSMTFLISLHLHDNRFCISFNIPKYIDSVFSCQTGENQGRGGGSRTLSGHQDRHPPQRHEQAILFFLVHNPNGLSKQKNPSQTPPGVDFFIQPAIKYQLNIIKSINKSKKHQQQHTPDNQHKAFAKQ